MNRACIVLNRARIEYYAFLMTMNAGFYGTIATLRLHDHSTLDSTPYNSSLRARDYITDPATNHEWENRRAVMLEHERNEGLVLKLTEEIKKTVNESMEDVVSGLRNEVTELRSELTSIKEIGEASRSCIPKQGKLAKMLLVSLKQGSV